MICASKPAFGCAVEHDIETKTGRVFVGLLDQRQRDWKLDSVLVAKDFADAGFKESYQCFHNRWFVVGKSALHPSQGGGESILIELNVVIARRLRRRDARAFDAGAGVEEGELRVAFFLDLLPELEEFAHDGG